ncbi:hypothetical protein [Trichodesmium erythraeum]
MLRNATTNAISLSLYIDHQSLDFSENSQINTITILIGAIAISRR